MGALSCFTGELLPFLTLVFSALAHEAAHSFSAARLGFHLNEIMLAPYGASIRGDISGVSGRDALKIFLAGPVCSALIAGLTAAAWWFFPVIYPYTENIFHVNAALAIVNLLPAFPLDGGRALALFLGERTRKKKLVLKIISVLSAAAIIVYAVKKLNLSAGIFSLFLLFGGGRGEYEKIPFPPLSSLTRGAEIRKVAVSENAEIKSVLKFISADKYLSLDVYSDKGEFLFSLRQEEIEELFIKKGLYAKISDIDN